MKIMNKRRWASLGLSAGLLVSGIAPALGAGAPATTVTTKLPAYITYYSKSDISSVNYRVISGTASNLTNPEVALRCIDVVTGMDSNAIYYEVPVVNGKWSVTINIRNLKNISACRLAATPSGFSWSGTPQEQLAATKDFKGPTIHVFEQYDSTASYISNGKYWEYDKGNYFTSNKASGQVWGAEDGGLWRLIPFGVSNAKGPEAIRGYFYRDGGYAQGPTGSDEAGLTVDGSQAFTSYNMSSADMNMANAANSGKYTVSINQKTGATTFTESYPLFKCAYPDPTKLYRGVHQCPDSVTIKLGVTWARVVQTSADGTVVNVSETFKSVDKKTHTVRFDEHFDVDANADATYRYGTTGAFGVAATQTLSKTSGFGYKYKGTDPISFDNPLVQVAFKTVPTSTWALGGGSSTYARWNVSVPKGKSATINAGVALITDDTKAAAQIALANK